MHGALMVCGTSSDSGKSTVVTGLCRLLARRGVRVAPFKGQNMSLNSMVTSSGGEMGRAQWLQAVAARAEPDVTMNPVLLKPTGERASQVVVMGRPTGVRAAVPYQADKGALTEVVDGALTGLRDRYEVVLLEGAGSPAEINLLDGDLVNLGLAARHDVPAILVGDIERGGVFAHLYGTVAILPPELSSRIRAFVINRFRGDRALLGDAARSLEDRCGVPTLGVLPHLGHLGLDAEDSLALARHGRDGPSDRTGRPAAVAAHDAVLDVAAIRLPRVSNFTDLDPLVVEPGVRVRWVESAGALGRPDLVVIPGSRSVALDLEWLRGSGLAAALASLRNAPTPPVVLGVCGGYQVLGGRIDDPLGVESPVSSSNGLAWLPVDTTFAAEKTTRLRSVPGPAGEPVHGYEIRHGCTRPGPGWTPWLGAAADAHADGHVLSARDESGTVFGTSLHGLFEEDVFRSAFLSRIAAARNRSWKPSNVSFAAAREAQIDRIADACEEHLDLTRLWGLLASTSYG